MQLSTLATVRHRIRIGLPLPFAVRDADHTLLLARGQVVGSDSQLEALMARGALVDIDELRSPRERIAQLPREQLPALWRQCLSRVDDALRCQPGGGFRDALDDASEPVLALVDRDPDLAIFQILRREGNADTAYGAQRSMHAAITAWLVARRLGWDDQEALQGFKVALTMNVSMLELQGTLAHQDDAPSPEQRAALASHPVRSVQMLQTAGVTDPLWLRAVLEHHEVEDGSGYPSAKTEVCDLASLVRRADVYTAKLSARQYRAALAADVAGRQMFMQDPGHPMTAALVKEFGIYPPGCHVRLASGEHGIVVQRGPAVNMPVVACLTDALGRALPEPRRIETADKRHAVVGIVGERGIDAKVTAERLMALGAV
jgi:HD-GYP domain-containing protein (c-di-GMP phosphodiesterase class II)